MVMGKLTSVSINIQNPGGMCIAGECINGEVVVKVEGTVNVKDVRITLRGNTVVHWTEVETTGNGRNRRQETRHFDAAESYMNEELLLFHEGRHEKSEVTSEKSYPFEVLLPEGIPTTYEEKFGRIRYWILASVTPDSRSARTCMRPFTIINHLDLNSEPNAQLGAHEEADKTLCCLCCKSGPISMSIKLDRCGFVPRETIPFHVEIVNGTSRRASAKIDIIMSSCFYSDLKPRKVVKVVATENHPGVPGRDKATWDNTRFRIPSLPPSNLTGCGIIDVQYMLQLTVEPKGPAFAFVIPIPIIIGTLSLQSIQDFSGGEYIASFSQSAMGPVEIKGDQDDDSFTGTVTYTPAYPWYGKKSDMDKLFNAQSLK